jgi:hypothetical protein
VRRDSSSFFVQHDERARASHSRVRQFADRLAGSEFLLRSTSGGPPVSRCAQDPALHDCPDPRQESVLRLEVAASSGPDDNDHRLLHDVHRFQFLSESASHRAAHNLRYALAVSPADFIYGDAITSRQSLKEMLYIIYSIHIGGGQLAVPRGVE